MSALRDQEAPAHPARELVDARIPSVFQHRHLERPLDRRAPVGTADPVEVGEDEQVLLDRQRRVEIVELRRDPALGARHLRLLRQAKAQHLELALVRDRLGGEEAHRRRLARPVRPEQADAGPRRDIQVEMVDRRDRPVALDDAAQPDGELRLHPFSMPARGHLTANGRQAASDPRRCSGVGLVRAFIVVIAGLVAGVSLYVGFIQAGVIRNPFGPVVRGDLALARSDRAGMRVLFVGNSTTYYNSMPALVSELATGDEGAQPIFAVWYTAPGWSLRGAAGDEELRALLEEVDWDTVVLQEHGVRASAPLDRSRRESEPFARDLQRRIESGGARTIVFMNWPYRDLTDLASRLSAPVAPVGVVWDEALRRRPNLDLLARDGRHPNRAGSYLFACIFYATFTGRDPTRSTFTGGLGETEARFLQRVAADVALGSG